MATITKTAVLDEAHVGDIRGALGTISADDFAPRAGLSAKFKTLLAIVGPGLIVMCGDNDAGAFSTYGQAGQNYGTRLLWTLLLLVPVLYVNQEMVLRLGAVTGVGHAKLIIERFGKSWATLMVADLIILNALTLVTEFIGITMAAGYLGVPKLIAVLLATRFQLGVADPLMGLAVAAFLGWNAFGVFHQSYDQLMDRELPDAERERINDLSRAGQLKDEARRRIERELDLRDAQLSLGLLGPAPFHRVPDHPVQHVPGNLALDQVVLRSGPHRPLAEMLVRLPGQHDDGGLGLDAQELPQPLQALRVRQAQVEQHAGRLGDQGGGLAERAGPLHHHRGVHVPQQLLD